MAKAKWNEEIIIKRILMLESLGEDLTCSHVKEIDSALVGAAISYFGSWGAVLKAAGLDHDEIRAVSRRRRSEKVRKWSIDKVLEEIAEAAKREDDISYAYMKEKYSPLVAAASNYIGSWRKAVEMLGFDYNEVLRKGRANRLKREREWYRDLLLERLSKMTVDESVLKRKHPRFHRTLVSRFSTWQRVMKELGEYQKKKGTPNRA
ncbi:MAG: hypothetical protein AB1742_10335 [bacterium]